MRDQVPERQESVAMKLAAMDFSHAPYSLIRRDLNLSASKVYTYRKSPAYQRTMEELKAEWKETMLRTPGTADIRKTISWAMSVAVKKILSILSDPKTSNRDLIAAARLTAQIDGRFLSSGDENKPGNEEERESLAEELLKFVKKAEPTVQ